ncbi:hypothetical protein QJS66_00520 [Kocuria rhizophila]|nr:hypothetical protein QJS66_00520 [Kocuria rhizophila]
MVLMTVGLLRPVPAAIHSCAGQVDMATATWGLVALMKRGHGSGHRHRTDRVHLPGGVLRLHDRGHDPAAAAMLLLERSRLQPRVAPRARDDTPPSEKIFGPPGRGGEGGDRGPCGSGPGDSNSRAVGQEERLPQSRAGRPRARPGTRQRRCRAGRRPSAWSGGQATARHPLGRCGFSLPMVVESP